MGIQNVQQMEFSYSFIVLYFIHYYMQTYRIVELERQHSCYIINGLMFNPYRTNVENRVSS